jgi:hypothetical protein
VNTTGSPDDELIEFLVQAKRSTYAAGGSDSAAAVPAVLAGSHQLEYRRGDLLYRDIYFGAAYFAGQETVYRGDDAMWAMCYAGGWTDRVADPGQTAELGAFLQSALKQAPKEHPFRGPPEYRQGPYTYRNTPDGDYRRFSGVEHIEMGPVVLYQLHYCGGLLY